MNCYKLLLLLMSLTISCHLSFCLIFCLSFFFLCRPTQKAVFLSPFLPLSLLSLRVNIYIIISKFLNDKSREINLHTYLISDSPVNYAFLAVTCLYYVICHSFKASSSEVVISQEGFLITCQAVWCLA